MSRKTWRSLIVASPIVLGAVLVTSPAFAQTTADRAQKEARQTGNAVSDGWITMKVHSQFIPEDTLEGSDIDVDTNNGVVTLNGTVPTAAGKARAVAIAKATDGVKSVNDKLRIAPAAAATAREAGREAAEETREAGRTASGAAREAGRETAEGARKTTGTTGRAVTDGWIKSKIYSQYLVEDSLDDSDIDLDIRNGVVSLNGTVRSEAGKTRAAAIAKETDGVKSVKNNLKVSPKQ